MTNTHILLNSIFDGWNGYQKSIVNAVAPLTQNQLAWRPADNFNTVGELIRHISLGRVTWCLRMDAPGSAEIASQIYEWETDSDGNRDVVEKSIAITEDPVELIKWLEKTWQMVDKTLNSWTVSDLAQTYKHTWNGKIYTPSRQWTLWRVMNHDLHHGGELSLMLGIQGIEAFELSALFGHIILPPLLQE